MRNFAQIFEFPDIGMVLAKHGSSDAGEPELRLSFQSGVKGLGECSIAVMWDDDEEGWRQSEAAMETLERNKVEAIVRDFLKQGPISLFAPHQEADNADDDA